MFNDGFLEGWVAFAGVVLDVVEEQETYRRQGQILCVHILPSSGCSSAGDP